MSELTQGQVRNVVEAVLFGAGRPFTVQEFVALFHESGGSVDAVAVRRALSEVEADLAGRALELREVASGYRVQVRVDYAPWLAQALSDRPQRYSRALLETLVLIAYRQPATRGEIEDVRGVSVSSSIMKTLTERDWIRVLGHRDVPGRPAMYGTTRTFLDDFNLRGLEDLPPLAAVRDIDRFHDDLFGGRDSPQDAEPGSQDVPALGSETPFPAQVPVAQGTSAAAPREDR